MERSLIGRVALALSLVAAIALSVVPCLANDGEVESKVEAPASIPTAEDTDVAAKPLEEVYLDADEVSYDEYTGIAIAQGDVKVRNKSTKLLAPYLEYHTETNIVDAYSDYQDDVIIYSGPDKFVGKHLKYNLVTRRGVLTDAKGKSEAMFMSGGTARIMPIEDAVAFGIVKARRRKPKIEIENESVAQWLGVTATTCDFTNPHYRLVSKKVIMYPERHRTVLKSPKFYIGKKLVMSYPFDYIAAKKNKNALMPIVRYNSDKGVGAGLRGPIDLGEWGELDLAFLYWTDGFWETRIRYAYEITDQLTYFMTFKRLYNDDTDQVLWRPSYGLDYEHNGWEARLWLTERDLTSNEVEPDVSEDYDVWRRPEFFVNTPEMRMPLLLGNVRVFGVWGRYGDQYSKPGKWVNRFAYGAQYTGQPDWSLGIFKPYYGARFTHYDYYNNDRSQDVTRIWGGFRYKLGAFNLTTGYNRRWGNRNSPMRWDRYGDSEKFIQNISFPLPIGEPWEKWTLGVNTNYDMIKKSISSIRYSLNYNKHCMTWRIWYKDNRSDDETTMGLTFYINAYPEYKLEIGSENTDSVKEDF